MNVTSPTVKPEPLMYMVEAAAQRCELRPYDLRKSGKGIAFTLKTSGPHPRYRRLGRYGRTLPGRVCWHGVRDFLRELYGMAPDAKVRTAMATYSGAADFERTYPSTYEARSDYMGYLMAAPADQPCACSE